MKKSLAILVMLCLFLPGCADQRIFEQIGFILNIGIESSKDGDIMVTYTSPVIGEGKAPTQVEIITVTGGILREARINVRRRSSKLLEAGKIQQVLISKELAQKKSVHELLEVLERDPVDPVQAWVVIVDGSPKEMLEKMTQFKDKPRPAIYLNQLFQNSVDHTFIPETKVYNFDIDYFAEGIDPMVPMIKYSDKEVIIAGSALFLGDRLREALDTRQTFLTLALKGRAGNTQYVYISSIPGANGTDEKKASLLLKNCKNHIAAGVENSKPSINISLNFEAYLTGYDFDDMDKIAEKRKVETYTAEEIQKDCEAVIKYIRETGCDPLGIGDIYRSKYNDYWKTVNWNDAYKNTVFNVDVTVNIKEYGAIN